MASAICSSSVMASPLCALTVSPRWLRGDLAQCHTIGPDFSRPCRGFPRLLRTTATVTCWQLLNRQTQSPAENDYSTVTPNSQENNIQYESILKHYLYNIHTYVKSILIHGMCVIKQLFCNDAASFDRGTNQFSYTVKINF